MLKTELNTINQAISCRVLTAFTAQKLRITRAMRGRACLVVIEDDVHMYIGVEKGCAVRSPLMTTWLLFKLWLIGPQYHYAPSTKFVSLKYTFVRKSFSLSAINTSSTIIVA